MSTIVFVGGDDVSSRIELSNKLMKFGYKIDIVGTEKEDKFIQNGIPYQKYYFDQGLSFFNDIRSILALRNILKNKEKNTIIHAFDTKPAIFLPLAAIGLKHIKISRTINGMGRIFTEKNIQNLFLINLYKIIQKSIMSKVDFTIFQNDDDNKYFMENNLFPKNRSKTIKSSGIDLKKFATQVNNQQVEALGKALNIDKTQKTFILVSRMVKQKGIFTYLKAAKLCYEKGYNYNFLLVGQLDRTIKQKEIDDYHDYVNYLGRREDIKELLKLADIFVLPTYYREGVPRVLLEASAMGLALITTNMPGCKDVVTDGYNGKLININDEHDLSEKMIYIAENEEELEKYQQNSQEKVKEFDLDLVVKNYHEVYKNLIKDKKKNVESTTI